MLFRSSISIRIMSKRSLFAKISQGTATKFLATPAMSKQNKEYTSTMENAVGGPQAGCHVERKREAEFEESAVSKRQRLGTEAHCANNLKEADHEDK